MPTTCTTLFKLQHGYPEARKVIDASGRVGSLYDIDTDGLVDRYSIAQCEGSIPKKPYVCRLLAGGQSKRLIDYLPRIDFHPNMLQNLNRQATPTLSGIGRVIEYDQQVTSQTRLLYYSYRDRTVKAYVKARRADRIAAPPSHSTEATHMITKILWGFEFVCVIQPPRDQSMVIVDRLLSRLLDLLKSNKTSARLTNDQRYLIKQWDNTAIYGSERCIDDPRTPLLTVLDHLRDWQNNQNFHHPILYNMQPLRWLFGTPFQRPCNAHLDDNSYAQRARAVQSRIDQQLKEAHALLVQLPVTFASPTLTAKLREIQRQHEDLLDLKSHLDRRLQTAMPHVRSQRAESTVLSEIIADKQYQNLHRQEMDDFLLSLERLVTKSALIDQLKQDRIEYVNVYDVRPSRAASPTNAEFDVLLKRSYVSDKHAIILWYASDRLKREQAARWSQMYQDILATQQRERTAVKLIYADYTNCQERLDDFARIRLPPMQSDPIRGLTPQTPRTKSNPTLNKPRPSSHMPPLEPSPRRSRTPPPPTTSVANVPLPPRAPVPSSKPKTDLNVLLLGETGTGKSTFINAFVNYLKFDTLQQAEHGEPVVIIPVSFLLTVGERFDEVTVQFGAADPNEDYAHDGQSVTQQCKSYVFDLNDQIRVRLIDTPGFGDTRGVEQDAENIDHVLTYIQNLSHINAVCLLLKPNASRLNVFLRSCIRQLLTYVTPVGYPNILFCFTNSRATFYAPGDTGPLLRKMLADENFGIAFQRENTFCFDSESFRYLVARRCEVEFDEYQTKECRDSWTTSVTESVRLLNFIQTRKPYCVNAWMSPGKATLDIATLARPLMETLRLIVYNWQLSESKVILNQIALSATSVDVDLCTNCAQANLVQIGPFWIIQYQRVLVRTSANQHRLCPKNGKHVALESIVQHEFISQPAGLRNERWQSSFHNFLLKCDTLLHFLRQHEASRREDPFASILDRFLEEEQQISQHRTIDTNMNRKVCNVLASIGRQRQLNQEQIARANERLSLKQVYQIIAELTAIPTVQRQLESIKRSRQLKMRTHEIRIETSAVPNSAFARVSNVS